MLSIEKKAISANSVDNINFLSKHAGLKIETTITLLLRKTAMSFLKAHSQMLYDTDYLQWIETTVEKLQSQDYANVDWENLIEEMGDMVKSERSSLKSNFIIILVHLLKWQFQPQKQSGSWEGSIIEHRRRVKEALDDSPSLKSYLESVFAECYTQAVKQAKAETNLPVESFGVICPYKLAEVTNDEFLPQ